MYSTSVNDALPPKTDYSFLNVDPFPFTNANLEDPVHMGSFDDEDGFETSPPFAKKTLNKAERRAEHNAIERARRESLNNKFQQLAQALPNLMNYRRPSKSQIVEKALDWVKKSISREERYRYQVIQLQKENKKLLAQLMATSTSSPITSPSASVSTPTTNTHFHPLRQQHTTSSSSSYSSSGTSAASTTNTAAVAAAAASIPSPSNHQHLFANFLPPSDTVVTTTPTLDCSSSFLYDLTAPNPAPPSWFASQHLPPTVATSRHPYLSTDDINQPYNRKELDPVVFQSPSTDLYLDTMIMSNTDENKFQASPNFIQPMISRSTPAFSSSRHR